MGKEDPAFTVGFDYERRINKLFGFGGMIDWVVGIGIGIGIGRGF